MFDLAIHVIEACGRERRARREDRAQRGQGVLRPRLEAGLLERTQVFRAGAEDSDVLTLGKTPQDAGIGVERRDARGGRRGRSIVRTPTFI